MFDWIYDLPALGVIVLFEAVFVGVFWLGAIFLRRFTRSWLKEEPRLNDMLAAFFQFFGVIYGLLLGLLAVATYQARLDVEKSNANEAASLSALYRNITAYPEPSRTELQNLLRSHTRYLIEDAWPQQRKGIVPVDEFASDYRAPGAACAFRAADQSPRTFASEYLAAIQHLLRGSKGADLQPHLWHPSHPLVHSGCRGAYQHDILMVVRPPPACSFYIWRTYLILPRHHHFGDCPDGSPLPRRARPVTRCLPTDLPGDEIVVSGISQARARCRLPRQLLPRSGHRACRYESQLGP